MGVDSFDEMNKQLMALGFDPVPKGKWINNVNLHKLIINFDGKDITLRELANKWGKNPPPDVINKIAKSYANTWGYGDDWEYAIFEIKSYFKTFGRA